MLAKLFPTYGLKNVRLYYVLSFLFDSFFFIATWVFFSLLYVSEVELSFSEVLTFGVAALVEIPSGAFADLFGRKRTVILATIFLVVGCILFALTPVNKILFYIGNIIIVSGFSLRSGALEALIFDTLKNNKLEDKFDLIRGRAETLTILALLVAALAGGVMWTYGTHLPNIATIIMWSSGFLVSLFLIEAKFAKEESGLGVFKQFSRQVANGFKIILSKEFRAVNLSSIIILSGFFIWDLGVFRVFMGKDFGYEGDTLSYLISACLVVTLFGTFFFERIRSSIGDRLGFAILGVVMGLSWVLASLFTGNIVVGAIIFILITFTGSLNILFNSVVINNIVESKDRATSISTVSFMTQIIYMAMVLPFGLAYSNGYGQEFYFAIGAVVFLAGIIFYLKAGGLNKMTENLGK